MSGYDRYKDKRVQVDADGVLVPPMLKEDDGEVIL